MQTARADASTDVPELKLLARLKAGDRGAFVALMRRYNQKLYRSAEVIRLGHGEDCDEQALETTMDETRVVQTEAQPEGMALRGEMRKLLEAKIDLLPETFRTVFMLRAVEEMTVEETAAALGIPEATVRTRFFRAKGALREALARGLDLAVGDAFAFAGARCDRIVERVLARLDAPPGV